MTRSAPAQRSFSSGEISPLLVGRPDYQRHQTGLATCRGFIPLRQGAVTRAPGTRHLGRTHGDEAGRLIPFVFNDDDALTLEFTPNRMRVWRYGALVMDGGAPYELATPWQLPAIRRLQWVQSADVIYICDGTRAPRKLSRRALDDWSLDVLEPSGGPLRAFNDDETLTVESDGETGTVTLTASSALFEASHVGGLFALRVQDWSATPLWSGNTTVVVGDRMRYDGQVYELTDLGTGTTTGVNPPVHRSGKAQTQKDGPTWKHVGDDLGLVRITARTSSTVVTATVLRRIPSELVGTGTPLWAEGAWSDRHGWPAALAIYEQRLYFAATQSDPRTVWASTVGAFEDFATGAPDQSFAYAIDGARNLNRVVWLAAGARGLHVGAQGEVHSARSTQRQEVLTAENAFFQLDATIGVHKRPPVTPDGRPIFVSRDRTRVYELRYRFSDDSVTPIELSLPAEHLGSARFDEIAWQSAPLRFGWITRDDADLACMVYDPDEEVLGWATVPVAGGEVESVAVTPGLEGNDEVTMIVRRVVDGVWRRYVERLSPFYGVVTGALDIADAEHLYCAVVHPPGDPTFTFGGLEHLEGQTVHAWTNRGQFGPFTVSGASITLPVTARRAVIGLLDDSHRIETLDLFAAGRDGDTMGRPVRTRRLGLRLHRTGGYRIRPKTSQFGRDDVELEWQDRQGVGVPGDLTLGWSGIDQVPFGAGWDMAQRYEIAPLGAAPMTLLALTPEVEARG